MHSHQHSHEGHHHDVSHVSDARLLWSFVLNQILTVAQVTGGIISGSVSLLSDAAHNFADANALLIAYIARRISRKQANEQYTFGYRRAELIGAMINLTVLGSIAASLIYEGVHRLFAPHEVIGWLMGATALLALVVDTATALLLWAMSEGSTNVRAAFLHNIVDALGSLAVLVGAAAIIYLNWIWVDAVLTLLIAAYIIWQVATMLPEVIRILMQGAPAELNTSELVEKIGELHQVVSIHHVHVWQLDEHHRSLEAHIVIEREHAQDMDDIKQRIKECIQHEYHIGHSTLEFEFQNGDRDCDNMTC